MTALPSPAWPRFVRAAAAAALLLLLLPGASAQAARTGVGSEWLASRIDGRTADAIALGVSTEGARRVTESLSLRFMLEGRRRLSGFDADAADLRELLLEWRGPAATVRAGMGNVFWGVTESRHLVDVVNQLDTRFDLSGHVKLGQPMAAASLPVGPATLDAYLLPCHRRRPLPWGSQGAHDRQADGAWVELDCDGRVGKAVRLSLVADALDLGLGYFDGIAREPAAAAGGRTYPEVRRWSLDGQLTLGSWLLKLEALGESRPGPHRRAAVAGFEYTLANLAAWADIGLLYEHLEESDCPAFTCGDMAGIRIGLNDEQDTQALFTALRDSESGRTGYLLQAERRLGSAWKLKLDARRQRSASFLSLRLQYFF
ncbi:hypothetical protein OOT46_03355 [Aquabacterium sp. A7-Y]|uniref:hypothetical protein n=1 Tax=Aquabacterium sp. A7-Y TaxID=1349605 RepID=UPI00223D07E9|nr:hypothetical protein [Aquabacterium sp. A7-Y]MCW7536890.1 hypothetical protein [Aquabacterium sp. A7-Y]